MATILPSLTAPKPPTIVLVLALVLAAVIWGRKDSKGRRSSLPLPPGPRPLPVIGNLFDMPTKRLAPTLRELGDKYGDIVYLDMLGQPIIVINSYDAAIGLLEGRSTNTSDRQQIVMAELTGFLWEFAIQGYTQEWRVRRRTFHGFFQPGVLAQYYPVHLRECRLFLHRLLATPKDFISLARHVFSATIMDVVYGLKVSAPEHEHEEDPYVSLAERGTAIFSRVVVPGQYLVELVPALRHVPAWLPGAGFKRDAARWAHDVDRVRNGPYDASLDALAKGVARPCMVTSLVEKASRETGKVPFEDDQCFRDVAGLAYLTGADTTLFSTQALFLAMVVHPEAQKKGQEELDAVIGPDRLPEFSDRDALPYVNAIVKEVIRWHSVVPLGVAHRVMEEDEYGGYCIPAGSIVIPNAWAMSRDPEAYPDPDAFIPERFMTKGEYGSDTRDPEKFQFGFGRRICPGRHFANDSLFITVASLLQVFNIEQPLRADGKPVPVVPKANLDYFLSHPEKFECRITPRSEKAEALIRNGVRNDSE
ncbi:O-methylsterigmatocystin oxidoreductase [Trametes polyzona]|nr:O-methylsterigmatocystin oxidoreductase [Trametes polyzona]